ncbi:Equilibrative Nucleoside Transporter (ENT) Family [Achlya hypogyna]|uniref:Equilibrative Nucleoside Transporter (ENT) Family n=1 Tax=Achlya hypogyna TaxID=1202772 RepID=A0A1V9Z024_ACHHY|nr:Equilibrative Nucleoside Transporter (ENT) Family [Achlya hypogyna]
MESPPFAPLATPATHCIAVPPPEWTPRDTRQAHALFLFMGLCYYFPFCILVQPVDYWRLLFPSFNVNFRISFAYYIANVLVIFALLVVGARQSYKTRIMGGFSVQLGFLLLLPTSYYILSTEIQHEAMVLTTAAIVAIAAAVAGSSLFALASMFPSGCMENVQLGIGLSIFITTAYRCISKAVFSTDETVAASMVYFYTGALTMATGVMSYFLLLRLPQSAAVHATPQTHKVLQPTMLSKIAFNGSLVVLVNLSTMLVWPGLLTDIPSFNVPIFNTSGWFPLILMGWDALFDALGRYSARFQLCFTRHNVWALVFARCLCIPVFICIARDVCFTHDIVTYLVVAAFSWSHGYAGALTVVFVSDCVDENERSGAGMFSSFFVNFGLVTGASLSFVLAKILHL